MRSYDEYYYKGTYGKNFVEKQQGWLDDYFKGRDSGYTTRINYLLRFSQYYRGREILDLGCGVGTFALVLAQQGYNTAGLDISQEALEQCRENAARLGIKNTKFLFGDCTENVFDKSSFDGIIAADIFEHLPPHLFERSLINCYNWLRPGGILVVHTFPTYYYHLIRSRITSLLLLPAVCLPEQAANIYIKHLHYPFYEMWHLFRTGRTYSKQVASSGHCNPVHPFTFRRQLENAGFEIIKYELLQEILTGLQDDKPRTKFGEKIIQKIKMLRPTIIAVARKRMP